MLFDITLLSFTTYAFGAFLVKGDPITFHLRSFTPAQYVHIQLGRKPHSRLELHPNA
jgi:hypothetical protein